MPTLTTKQIDEEEKGWNYSRTCFAPEENVLLFSVVSQDIFLKFVIADLERSELLVNITKIERKSDHAFDFDGATTNGLAVMGTAIYLKDGSCYSGRIMWEKPKSEKAQA